MLSLLMLPLGPGRLGGVRWKNTNGLWLVAHGPHLDECVSPVSPSHLLESSKSTMNLDLARWLSHRRLGMPHGTFARCHSFSGFPGDPQARHRTQSSKFTPSHTCTKILWCFLSHGLGHTLKIQQKKMNFACWLDNMTYSTHLGGNRWKRR